MSERTRFVAYITKYALTIGIEKMEVEDCFDINPNMVADIANPNVFYHANEWHRSANLAIARAERMRDAKIASHRRSITKLENMHWSSGDAT